MTTTTDLIKANGKAQARTGKRANWTIEHKTDTVARLITWTVRGAGENGTDARLTLDVGRVSATNRLRAEFHGFVQRVSDAAALPRDTKTGQSATAQEKLQAMQRLVEHYESGGEEWSPAREGGARVVKEHPQAELLRVALGLKEPGKDVAAIAKWVAERSAAQITALVTSELLKVEVQLAKEELEKREQAAVAESGVNAEELLGTFVSG